MVERKSLNSQLGTLNSSACGERGGKGTRTPDIQLAKLALYQLSYAPGKIVDGEWLIVDGDFKGKSIIHQPNTINPGRCQKVVNQQTLDGAFFLYLDLRSFRSIGFSPAVAGSDSPCRGQSQGLGVTP